MLRSSVVAWALRYLLATECQHKGTRSAVFGGERSFPEGRTVLHSQHLEGRTSPSCLRAQLVLPLSYTSFSFLFTHLSFLQISRLPEILPFTATSRLRFFVSKISLPAVYLPSDNRRSLLNITPLNPTIIGPIPLTMAHGPATAHPFLASDGGVGGGSYHPPFR
ncbi:hypothetical protein CC80DRAFT_113099 [Byssothecium circinans]|uniref:Secreted protein n=1 Tax=Byssothecium circinans TaxID=147558 RepID=A0A6A5TS78_9PLEO|nr:hypothetical protein CC80DRAFT_113099 [Byssothecium circinans]